MKPLRFPPHLSLANRPRRNLGCALGLMLLACSPSGGASEGEGGDSGASSGATSTEGASDGPTMGAGDTSGTGDTSGPAATSGTDAGGTVGTSGTDGTDGTTGELCMLEDDNVACDAHVTDHSRPLAGGPTSTLRYEGPVTWTSPALDAPAPCDVYAQDCPEGQKCNPYADDGGNAWNATGCFELYPLINKLGEACSADGANGPDSCEPGAICIYDPVKGSRFCESLCSCSADNPVCGAGMRCVRYNGGALPLCKTLCDPLDLTSCPHGEVCVFTNSFEFMCVGDFSGELGDLGDGCGNGFSNCDPGYSCEAGNSVPGGCSSDTGACCTPLCDLTAPACPQGSTCLEYFGGFGLDAPVCLEDVGYCVADGALVDPADRFR